LSLAGMKNKFVRVGNIFARREIPGIPLVNLHTVYIYDISASYGEYLR